MTNVKPAEAMIDLETFGTGNKAVLLSIGAVMFDPRGEGINNHFEIFVDPISCVEAGLIMDPATVMWWMNEARDAARKELMACPRVSLRHALLAFMDWMQDDRPVWGNGATFDNVILRNAYAAVGLACPWSYWNDRCYRTMKSLYPDVKMIRQGTHHSAAADALSQAVHLQAIFKSISGEK